MGNDKLGRIVWHDLFTEDRQQAMSFYQAVAGWHYVSEHATEFAWGSGAQDYVLAMSGDEAGAGIIEAPAGLPTGWVAYVEVSDVDATAHLAQHLGGGVLRAPFEVPGVGRNALLRDPLGAVIGIALSRHAFPIPHRQFGAECYASANQPLPLDFYGPLFGWAIDTDGNGTVMAPDGTPIATQATGSLSAGQTPHWVPDLNVVADAKKAKENAAKFGGTSPPHTHFIRDPSGALIHLTENQAP